MAKEISLTYNINNSAVEENLTSIKALKAELKATKDQIAGLEEGSEAFLAASKKAGELNNKLQDINKNISSQSGAPIERLAGSFDLLKSKVLSLNFKDAGTAVTQLGSNLKGLNLSAITEGLGGLTKGFLNLGKAILANPIFLIATVIIAVGIALFELKDKIAIIGKAFDFFSGIISGALKILTDFTDAIGLTTVAAEDNAKKIIEAATASEKAIEQRYAKEIALAKQAGQTTADLELQKVKDLQAANEQKIKALEDLQTAGHRFTEDEKKQLTELKDTREKLAVEEINAETAKQQELKKIRDDYRKEVLNAEVILAKDQFEARRIAAQQEYDARIEQVKKLVDARRAEGASNAQLIKEFGDIAKALDKKLADDLAKIDFDAGKEAREARKKRLEEERDEFNKHYKELIDAAFKKATDDSKIFLDAENKKNEELKKKLKERFDAAVALQNEFDDARAKTDVEKENLRFERQLKNLQEFYGKDFAQTKEFQAVRENAEKEHQDNLSKIDKEARDKKIEEDAAYAQARLNQVQIIADGIFAVQLASAEKGSARELAIKKKQFALEKAIGITSVVISTAKAVAKDQEKGYPASLVLTVLDIAVGAAQIAKIASQKFPGGGGDSGGSGGSPNLGSTGGGGGGNVPNVGQKLFNPNTIGAAGNQNGAPKQPPIRVVMVESDVTRVQNKVNLIETQAKI